MSKERRRIAEKTGDRRMAVSSLMSNGNGHNGGSGLLSWYFTQPRADGLTYVLTAKGYVILSTGRAGSGGGVDRNELMM
jgi:hypothetical protein